MTVNLVGSVDYSKWGNYDTTSVGSVTSENIATDSITYEDDSFVSSSGEKCTDGKDDGKIGFFSAIGNAIKGIGKSVVNGVKGMFTDSEGNFSLGKTLLSIGTLAACVAFPAVGVAACAIGGTMGAIQVGKGIYNAATAETDAEAKEAWQNIGSGAFTVATSAVGAKAGVKGMKSAAAKTTKGSALEALQNSGTKLTAKTAGQYGKAFVQDGVRSSKYNLGQIKTSATAYVEAAKVKYAEAKASNIQKNSGALTADELHAVNNAKYQRMFATDDTLSALDKIDDISTSVTNAKNTAIKAATHPLKTIQTGLSKINSVKLSDVSAQLNKLGGNATKIFDTLKKGGYNEAIKNFSESEVAQVLEIVAGVTFANESV